MLFRFCLFLCGFHIIYLTELPYTHGLKFPEHNGCVGEEFDIFNSRMLTQIYIQSKRFNIFYTNHANLMGEEQDIKSKWIVIKGKSLAQFQMEDSVGLRG